MGSTNCWDARGCKNIQYFHIFITAKGSACFQEILAPQESGLIFSDKDSGTANKMKQMSITATTVATSTTRLSP